jgi:hypothetical protein
MRPLVAKKTPHAAARARMEREISTSRQVDATRRLCEAGSAPPCQIVSERFDPSFQPLWSSTHRSTRAPCTWSSSMPDWLPVGADAPATVHCRSQRDRSGASRLPCTISPTSLKVHRSKRRLLPGLHHRISIGCDERPRINSRSINAKLLTCADFARCWDCRSEPTSRGRAPSPQAPRTIG